MEQCYDQLFTGHEITWRKCGFRTSQRKPNLNSNVFSGENVDFHFQDMGLKEMVGEGNVICKMEPYNICFSLDDQGIMHPIGEHRPVRLLRIY